MIQYSQELGALDYNFLGDVFMYNLIQQIIVIMVVLVIGTVIISVSTGENKAKKLFEIAKLKKRSEKKTDDNVIVKTGKNKRNITTTIAKKCNAENVKEANVWHVLVRDKCNKHTIKKMSFTPSQLIDAPISIGRGDDVNLKISNQLVSEEHALIIYDDESESVIYVDNGSTNGSYINSYYDSNNNYCEGEEIETTEIEDGLTVFLWDTPIIFSRASKSNSKQENSKAEYKGELKTKVYNKRFN